MRRIASAPRPDFAQRAAEIGFDFAYMDGEPYWNESAAYVFTFPVAFLVTDLTNRAVGNVAARRVAWVGFAIAVVVSLAVAPWRIAVASGVAFILGQLLDITAFNKLRAMAWWKAPLIGSVVASVVDTGVFFFLAFAGSDMDWLMLAAGDLGIKWLMAALLLAPYRAMLPRLQLWVPAR